MTISTMRNAAFSLVELSIVLVILGLLVGGILSGQSLIRASELRSVTTEYQRYTTAIGTFRDKYFVLPGDMPNASSFWDSMLSGDGNGNGRIENDAGSETNEISTFWIDLSLSGLIEGSFTQTGGTTTAPGTHRPRAKMSSAAWGVAHLGTVNFAGVIAPAAATATPATPAASTFFANTYGNVFLYGSGDSALLPGGVLKAEEAWNIDTKIDDGKPDIGSITTLESQGAAGASDTRCSNRDTANVALAGASDYVLTSTSRTACALVLKTGY